MDFECMEARCSDAADLEKKGEKYFSALTRLFSCRLGQGVGKFSNFFQKMSLT